MFKSIKILFIMIYVFFFFTCLCTVNASDSITNNELGLIGYWPMNGNPQDQSGNNFHGTIYGSADYTSGVIDEALYVDGNLSYMELPNELIPHGDNAWEDFTISAWFKSLTDAFNSILIDHDRTNSYAGTKGNFFLYRTSQNTYTPEDKVLGFKVWNNDNANPRSIQSSQSLEINTWYFVTAISINHGETLKLFINGNENAQGSIGNCFANNSTFTFIGNFLENKRNQSAIFDDVRIYNRALSENEIQNLYKLGTGNNVKNNLILIPSDTIINPNQLISLTLKVSGNNIYALYSSIKWDSNIIKLLTSSYLCNDENSFFDITDRIEIPIKASSGSWEGSISQKNPAGALTGEGCFATLTFKANANYGHTDIFSNNTIFSDENGNVIDNEKIEPASISINDFIHGGIGSITGQVQVSNHSNIVVTIQAGKNNYSISTDENGKYTFTELQNKTFCIKFNAKKHLTRCLSVQVQNDSLTLDPVILKGGDLDGDNDIDFADFQILVNAYNTNINDIKYNVMADINEDQLINIQDLAILARNYSETGQECSLNEISASCLEIIENGLSKGDGNYTIDPDGFGGNPSFEVYCSEMQSESPKEYLNLIHTDDQSNYSFYGGYVWNNDQMKTYTRFKKIRINPFTLQVITDDLKFAEVESLDDGGIKLLKYGQADCCLSVNNDCGTANVNLKGTLFRLINEPQIVCTGFGHSDGTTTFLSDMQEVNLTGGGYCGGCFFENMQLEFIE